MIITLNQKWINSNKWSESKSKSIAAEITIKSSFWFLSVYSFPDLTSNKVIIYIYKYDIETIHAQLHMKDEAPFCDNIN